MSCLSDIRQSRMPDPHFVAWLQREYNNLAFTGKQVGKEPII
ncbi:MAG: hypothetical protein PHO05_02395 [bacterium]|nr:hypothetical protein [bacterium]